MTEGTLSLDILDARTQDIGKGLARMHEDHAQILNLSQGDIIEIKGNKTTVAKYIPSVFSDEEKNAIRLDGFVRDNANARIGDNILVRKIESAKAETVIVAPLNPIPPIDRRYIVDALDECPLVKGDNVWIPYFGGRLTFQVMSTVPEDLAVTVTHKTHFFVSSDELTLHDKDIIQIKEYMMGKIAMLEKLEQSEVDNLLSDIEKSYNDIRNRRKSN